MIMITDNGTYLSVELPNGHLYHVVIDERRIAIQRAVRAFRRHPGGWVNRKVKPDSAAWQMLERILREWRQLPASGLTSIKSE